MRYGISTNSSNSVGYNFGATTDRSFPGAKPVSLQSREHAWFTHNRIHARFTNVQSRLSLHFRSEPRSANHIPQAPLSLCFHFNYFHLVSQMSRAPGPDFQPHTSTAAAPAGPSLPPSQASTLLSSFTNFLTVAVHSILFYRKLYPEATFLTARAYNLPVHQSRHPGVCSWIRDAVAAVGAQIRSGSARQVALVIHAPDSFDVVERWIFDLQSFPATWGDKETFSGPADVAGAGDDTVNWTDVNESLRGALSRLSLAGQSRPDLPEGCTFTLGVELRDQAAPPIQVSFRFQIHKAVLQELGSTNLASPRS